MQAFDKIQRPLKPQVHNIHDSKSKKLNKATI